MTPFLTLLFVQAVTSFQIGILDYRMYITTNSSTVLFNRTRDECICYAFAENSSSFVLMNFYANDSRCELFDNYPTLASMLVFNGNSTIILRPYVSSSQIGMIDGLITTGTMK